MAECKAVGMEFYPFVLGAHGGFGDSANKLWQVLVKHAKKVQDRDWRHSWTAMSYSSVWRQKLSVAIARQAAIATQRRTSLVTRERVLGRGESGAECVG